MTSFHCVFHVNGIPIEKGLKQKCLVNGTDYTPICADEEITCVNPMTNYVACGKSAHIDYIDPSYREGTICTSKSSTNQEHDTRNN
jgi:hypothetical protein